MKKIIVILLSLLTFKISPAQSGWGYVNYTSYKLYNGNGSTNQYQAFPYTAAEFDNMLNTANSNTTITHTGETTLAIMCDGSTGTPHWNGDYYAIKFEFWFVPQETGTYTFGVNSDDASDISVGGTIVSTYYGGHGAGGYRWGTISLVAGTKYKVVARYQEYGGGDALYVRWSRPSAPNSYSYWTNEVTNVQSEPTKKARINFDFGSTLDKTKFTADKALNSTGWADITNAIDSVKIGTGYKGTIVPGQVEWSILDYWNGSTYIHIDGRKLGNAQPTDVTSVKILDLYDGPVSFYSWDGTWATYTVPDPVVKGTDSTSAYIANIRPMGGHYYALSCDITFATNQKYKPQSVIIATTNTVSTLYNSIVTVSDVYLAFKEYSNQGGLFGNSGDGGQFTYGIQYKNADVNDDGVFDETDCYQLLQHLTGKKTLVDTFNLKKTLRLIPPSIYNTITKSNWNTIPSYFGDTYNFDINTGKATDTFYLSGTWKGDVNLSHSATPVINAIAGNSVRAFSIPISNEINASILTEVVGDSVYAYITLDPLSQNVVGTQFQLNYDNSVLKFKDVKFITKGSPTNFFTDKGSYINLGSLISDGSTILDNTTTYKVSFSSMTKLDNMLGLISIGNTDAVNKSGASLKVKIN